MIILSDPRDSHFLDLCTNQDILQQPETEAVILCRPFNALLTIPSVRTAKQMADCAGKKYKISPRENSHQLALLTPEILVAHQRLRQEDCDWFEVSQGEHSEFQTGLANRQSNTHKAPPSPISFWVS